MSTAVSMDINPNAFTSQDTSTQDEDQGSESQDALSEMESDVAENAADQLTTSQLPPIPKSSDTDPDTTTKNNVSLAYPSVDIKPEPSTGDATNAHDLTDKQWLAILKINSLLYGFYIRERNEDVVRARHNAFVLKGSSTKPIIPYFHVEDGSSIQVQETKNAFQRSLAQNAFSKRCIETNISAGDFGIMAGISGTREKTKSSYQKDQKILKDQRYYAVYNFPRARVFLDEEELELSEKCQKMLRDIENDPKYDRLQQFYKLFGHVFVTSVLLGGQQKTTKFAAALSKLDEETQQDALRSAIGAKVNAQYIATSSQISKQTGQGVFQGDEHYKSLSSLGINANGGDTLIGSDVSQWVQTVAPCKNWRVIENEISECTYDLIGRFPGWSHIPNLFRQIASGRSSTYRTWNGKLSFMLNGRPLCWDGSKGTLRLYCPSDSADDHVKAVFRLDPAYMQAPFDDPEPPKYDRPYFLSCGLGLDLGDVSDSSWTRLGLKANDTDRASFSPEIGISAAESKNCRFSFRKLHASGFWIPKPYVANPIKHGDKIQLYCHSLGFGPFADLDRPPWVASPATAYPHNGLPTPDKRCDLNILFSYLSVFFTSERIKSVEMYDTGKMNPESMEICTDTGLVLPIEALRNKTFIKGRPRIPIRYQQVEKPPDLQDMKQFSSRSKSSSSIVKSIGKMSWEFTGITSSSNSNQEFKKFMAETAGFNKEVPQIDVGEQVELIVVYE